MKRIPALITLLLFYIPAHTDSIESGPSIEKIISDYKKIITISARIKQQVFFPGGEARFYSGDYSADSNGNLRVNFYYPDREIVINNKSGFYWYYPDKKIVYVKKNKNSGPGLFSMSIGKIIEDNSSDITVSYEGMEFYSFFRRAAVYSIISPRSSTVIKVWLDPDGLYVLRKYVTEKDGRELIREIYSEHVYTGDVYLPSNVEMFVRTSGGTIHTFTEYRNFVINRKLNDELFVFKKGKDVESRELDEM